MSNTKYLVKDTVGRLYEQERAYLHPLPEYEYETAKSVDAKANNFSTVQFETNKYSVPHKYVHQNVSIKAYPETIEVYSHGQIIAKHERLMGKHQTSYRLEDYLPLLEQRDRAILDAAPVKQNVPPELFKKLERMNDHDQIIQALKEFIGQPQVSNKIIKDPVKVIKPDLSQYDSLAIGKEA